MRDESEISPQALVATKGFEGKGGSSERTRMNNEMKRGGRSENRTGRAMRQELQVETHFPIYGGWTVRKGLTFRGLHQLSTLLIDYQALLV